MVREGGALAKTKQKRRPQNKTQQHNTTKQHNKTKALAQNQRTAAVGDAILALHIIQHHTRIVGACNNSGAICAYAHTPYTKPIAEIHGDMLLSASAHVAQMQGGIDGGVDEVAAITRELHVGDCPLCPARLHGFDGAELAVGAAAERQQRNTVAETRVTK